MSLIKSVKSVKFVKRYKFNLDESPKKRWEHILNDFKDEFPKVKEYIDSLIYQLVGNVL